MKENLNTKNILSISGEYLSNTIEKKPKGWRNGSYSGVLNEMGSHIIDLVNYILNETEFNLISSKSQSVISDVDDIVEAEFETKNGISFFLSLNWIKKEIRKPIFKLEIIMKTGEKFLIDQQQIKIFNSKNKLDKIISVNDLTQTLPYYLRGVDFTNQMLDLVNDNKYLATVNDAIAVNKTMNKILENENNFRR